MLEKTAPEMKEDDLSQTNMYTYDDIALMMDTFSAFLFGFLTVSFTFIMLLRIL